MIKMPYQGIPFVERNLSEFYCVFQYTDKLSDLHKKFEVASTYDVNERYQIWVSATISFWVTLVTSTRTRMHTVTNIIKCDFRI